MTDIDDNTCKSCLRLVDEIDTLKSELKQAYSQINALNAKLQGFSLVVDVEDLEHECTWRINIERAMGRL